MYVKAKFLRYTCVWAGPCSTSRSAAERFLSITALKFSESLVGVFSAKRFLIFIVNANGLSIIYQLKNLFD